MLERRPSDNYPVQITISKEYNHIRQDGKKLKNNVYALLLCNKKEDKKREVCECVCGEMGDQDLRSRCYKSAFIIHERNIDTNNYNEGN